MEIRRIELSGGLLAHIVVKTGSDDKEIRTSYNAHVPWALLQKFPMMRRQGYAENGPKVLSLAQAIYDMEMPHVLQHLLLEVQQLIQPVVRVFGSTSWDWRTEPRGTFHVAVTYTNDALIRAAIPACNRMLNALQEVKDPCVEAELNFLREAAQRGRVATLREQRRSWQQYLDHVRTPPPAFGPSWESLIAIVERHLNRSA